MMSQLEIKKLLQVLLFIRETSQTGTLTIVKSAQKAFFYFNQGQLIDAQTASPNADTGEDVVYIVLNWQTGYLQWQAGPPRPNQIFDAEQQADFYQAAEDLATLGYFENPQTNIDPEITAFFGTGGVEALSGSMQSSAVTASSAARPDRVEQIAVARLPHPPVLPGQPFVLKNPIEQIQDLVEPLRQVAFTGYATLENSAGDFALLACDNGLPTAAYMRQAAAETWADTAWNALKQWDRVSSCTLVMLRPELLVAWQALLGTHRPYQDLAATVTNLRGLVATFKRGNYSGTIILHHPENCYYHFIYQGQEVGTYKLQNPDNQLYPAGKDWTHLLDNPQARLDVRISRPQTLEKSSIFKPDEIITLAGTLSAVIGLVGKFSPLSNALTQLHQTTTELSSKYPFLSGLLELDLDTHSKARAGRLSDWLHTFQDLPRPEVWAAFEELLEKYMRPTCLKLGAQAFEQLFLRALGPAFAENLDKMDLKVKFWDSFPQTPQPSPSSVAWENQPTVVEAENPYDF